MSHELKLPDAPESVQSALLHQVLSFIGKQNTNVHALYLCNCQTQKRMMLPRPRRMSNLDKGASPASDNTRSENWDNWITAGEIYWHPTNPSNPVGPGIFIRIVEEDMVVQGDDDEAAEPEMGMSLPGTAALPISMGNTSKTTKPVPQEPHRTSRTHTKGPEML